MASISAVTPRAAQAPVRASAPAEVGRVLSDPASQAATYQAAIDRYCVSCHNDRSRTAGLSLQGRSLANAAADAEVWERVIRKVSAGSMPPVGMPRPDAATSEALVTGL